MTTPLERLALALFDAGPEGLTRSRINALFGGRVPALRLDRLLTRLEEAGAVRRWYVPTDGRWASRWAPCDGASVEWTADEVGDFWAAWLALFHTCPEAHPQPPGLRYAVADAGRRGVSLAHALEGVERYRRTEPAPSIDAWGVTLKMALPVSLADLARD